MKLYLISTLLNANLIAIVTIYEHKKGIWTIDKYKMRDVVAVLVLTLVPLWGTATVIHYFINEYIDAR